MTEWHRIEHKVTKEVQIVASLGGINLEEWNITPIRSNRPPGEHQTVNKDGTLVTDPEVRAAAEKRAYYEQMDRAEFRERVEARLAALEKAVGIGEVE